MSSFRARALAVTIGALVLVPPVAKAHFKLNQPPSSLAMEDGGKGSPPCGGELLAPSNVVTRVQGGSPLAIQLLEFIPHPGHYRIALSVNSRAELPPDPDVVVNADGLSVSAAIQSPPKFPILADGMFAHTDAFNITEWQGEVMLPNIDCAKCTLQVIEFMAEHPLNDGGGYFYHHCADLQITATPTCNLNPPVVTSVKASPDSVTPAANTATLSVVANTNAPFLTYQWFVGQSGDTRTPVSDGTSQSLVVHPTVTTSYWVRVTNSEGTGPPTCPVQFVDSETISISVDLSRVRKRAARH
jgi:hypothetical protein